MPHPENLTRRALLKAPPLIAGALLPPLPAASRSGTVRDRLWLWSHVAGSYNGQYNLPGKSTITPVEAAFYLSIPNVFMIQLNGHPEPQSLDQFAVPFRPLREVAWSIVDPQEQTPESERRAVLDFAFKTPNVTGVVMDDFFVHRKNWKPGQVADLSLDELRQVRETLHRGQKRLDLWVVLYEHQVSDAAFTKLVPHLELCDVVQVWIWYGKHVPEIPATLDKVEKLLPGKRKILGCFMWDFGDRKPQPIPVMQQQCEMGLRMLEQKRIEGMVFCGSWLCDRGLETVDWTREWIHKVGNRPL